MGRSSHLGSQYHLAEQLHLDAALVVAELEQVQQLPSDETDWRTATPSALIDFIL